jgi:hypothetical protein
VTVTVAVVHVFEAELLVAAVPGGMGGVRQPKDQGAGFAGV